MSTTIVNPENKPGKCHKPRAAWRQRLVQAERGIGNGARQDSIFFVHIFTSTLILLAGGVLGLMAWQWMLVIISLIMLFVAELFNQALKSMSQAFGEVVPPPVQQALGMSTAASMLALCGTLVVAGFTLGQRIVEMLG
ncbi:MAG: diacylglycerol kinase [Planctomycetota bacterium]